MRTDELEKLTRVSVSADRLTASLTVQPGVDPSDLTAESVGAILEGRGVRTSTELHARVEELVAKLQENPDDEAEIVVTRGVPPKHGEDGRFELDASLVQEDPGEGEGDPSEAADHYARSAFIVVDEGQKLGKLLPHSEAEDGLDVRGEVIKATPGRPAKVKFDDSVQVNEDGTVIARQKGQLEADEESLRVEPILVISESVDFSTGNVDFPGDVLIQRGVCDCFTVEAGGSLEIVELVEAASVKAGGSILLRRGMAGRGKGALRAGGDLEAKYLDGVDVTVLNDLRVQRELTNCSTYIGRCIRSSSCSIVGGKLDIRFGGQVRMLGGEAETETIVRLGVDPQLDRNARELEELLPSALNRITQVKQELEQLKKLTVKLTATQAESMMSLQFEITTAQSRFPQIKSGIQRIVEAYKRLNRATLTVEKSIMPGVTIVIGSKSAIVREQIRGPIMIAMDDSGSLVLKDPTSGSVSPISASAKLMPATDTVDMDDLARWLDNPMLREQPKAA